jgi:hypothetical protein
MLINGEGLHAMLTEELYQEAPPVTRPSPPRLLSKGRLTLMAVAFALELVLFFAGLLVPIDPGTRSILVNQTSSEFGTIQSVSPIQVVFLIFSHNFAIALVDTVPMLGILSFGTSMFATGVLAQSLIASSGVPGFFGAFLLLFPYSLVELSAYAVALGSGIMIIAALRDGRLRLEVKILAEEIVVVICLLLLAAIMEEATNLSLVLGLALWIPTGLAATAIGMIARRRVR